jgi:hypothetical protein
LESFRIVGVSLTVFQVVESFSDTLLAIRRRLEVVVDVVAMLSVSSDLLGPGLSGALNGMS